MRNVKHKCSRVSRSRPSLMGNEKFLGNIYMTHLKVEGLH